MAMSATWLEAHAGADIDDLNGGAFEQCLAVMFERLGATVALTETFDFGADLILTTDGRRIAVQAKRSNQKVGERAVQQVMAGMAYYSCDVAMVITNSSFNRRAVDVARSAGVELWDRAALSSHLRQAGMLGPPEPWQPPTCPTCGWETVVRRGRFGRFYGCPNYPQAGCDITAEPRDHRLRLADRAEPRSVQTVTAPSITQELPVSASDSDRGTRHAAPSPRRLTVRLVAVFVALGWLSVASMVAAAVTPSLGGQSQTGSDVVGAIIFGALSAWGTMALLRWRTPSGAAG